MKQLTDTTRFFQSQIVEWLFIKGPELFMAIYGK